MKLGPLQNSQLNSKGREEIKLKELEKSKNQYQVTNNNGIITLHTSGGVRFSSKFFDENTKQLILAVRLYYDDGRYDVDYIFLDNAMNINESFTESEGVMPSFILAPDKSVWVVMESTKSDKARDIVLPLSGRTRIEKDNLLSTFVDWNSVRFNGESIQFWKDIFDAKKQDKMCRYNFDKNNLFKSRKVYKLPLPTQNEPNVNNGTLHLSNTIRPNNILHREIDLEGNILRQREFSLGMDYHFAYPVALAFDDTSVFFVTDKNEMYQVKVSSDGSITDIVSLHKVSDCQEFFYSVRTPLVLANDAYIVRFNYDTGSGYTVIKNDIMQGCYTCPYKDSVYTDDVSGEKLDMVSPMLMLMDAVALSDKKYALIFGAVNTNVTDKEIKIIIRKI